MYIRSNLDKKSREGDLYAGHDSPCGVSLPFRPSGGQLGSCVDAHTVNCFTTGQQCLPSPLQSIDGACSLFLSLPWSASLPVGIRGRKPFVHFPHLCQLTLGLLEICASTECSINPSLHPVQALKTTYDLYAGQ